ncbi:MAG: MFS transporter, partial [Sphingomonas hengshuiensis]
FAALNLVGALLVRASLSRSAPMMRMHAPGHFWSAWVTHIGDARLRRCYAIGFLILFAFIGVFTYVGFVLAGPPLSVSMRSIGVIFLCFAPSMLTTPFAGQVASRYGAARVLPLSLVLAVGGLALMLVADVVAVFIGMVLVALGTFFAQAIATGFVGRVATTEKAAASGLYLFFYYSGGLVGAAVVGQLFDQLGWLAAVIASGIALLLGAVIGLGLTLKPNGLTSQGASS